MTVPAPFCPAHPGGTFEACEDCAKARGDRWEWLEAHGAERTNNGKSIRDAVARIESGLDRVEALVDREDGVGEGAARIDALVGTLVEVIGVAALQPHVRQLDAPSKLARDRTHGSPSIGGPGVGAPRDPSEPIVGVASGVASPAAPDASPTTRSESAAWRAGRAQRLALEAEVVPLHDFTQPGAPLTGYRARLQGEHITPRWIGDLHRTRAAAERDIDDLIGAAS